MQTVRDLESTSTGSDSGSYSNVFIVGNKAHIITALAGNEVLIRFKYEVWKEFKLLLSVDRAIGAWENKALSIDLTVKALQPVHNAPVLLQVALKTEKESIHNYVWTMGDREDTDKYAVCLEVATSPLYPHYNAPFIALINSGLWKYFHYGFDDKSDNWLYDKDTNQILGIDILNLSDED